MKLFYDRKYFSLPRPILYYNLTSLKQISKVIYRKYSSYNYIQILYSGNNHISKWIYMTWKDFLSAKVLNEFGQSLAFS